MVSEAESDRAPAGFSRFYKTRRRVYCALLLFVIVVGVPIAAVSKLRDRLMTRSQALWEAAIGRRAPVMVQVGENHEPLPAEFERLEPTGPQVIQLPPPAKVHSTAQGGYTPSQDETRPSSAKRSLKIPSPSTVQEEAPTEEAEQAAADNEPKYQQGKMEQEAYDLLLQSNPAIAGIVKGNNPSFRFKSWSVAGRGEDTYWVRLKLEAEGKPEADYIWQVKLESKQVSPLNYNARSIF